MSCRLHQQETGSWLCTAAWPHISRYVVGTNNICFYCKALIFAVGNTQMWSTFVKIVCYIFVHVCPCCAQGYKLCIVTPGNKPDDIILLTKELAPLFDQTVLAGYPPFLKGVVDKGISQVWKCHASRSGIN